MNKGKNNKTTDPKKQQNINETERKTKDKKIKKMNR